MSAVVADAVEHLVRGIVANPDDVRVELLSGGRGGRLIEVHVNPEDLGKVIGRNGRTATALRTLVSGIGGRGLRVDIVDTDR
ncbi:RNA-binding protein [Gordonia sp. X0973]|uniref:RNA-binding protein n=1 Tax=unclassified Gordonia (in: high G+C Gram-positive bacteria) TaxID=2657482 RepID=UPI000F52135A|nr:RNA-binding protein [Gordonia sp. X0973]QKT07029.1 RNA-binding protein [Gordonia sp. X0973]